MRVKAKVLNHLSAQSQRAKHGNERYKRSQNRTTESFIDRAIDRLINRQLRMLMNRLTNSIDNNDRIVVGVTDQSKQGCQDLEVKLLSESE